MVHQPMDLYLSESIKGLRIRDDSDVCQNEGAIFKMGMLVRPSLSTLSSMTYHVIKVTYRMKKGMYHVMKLT